MVQTWIMLEKAVSHCCYLFLTEPPWKETEVQATGHRGMVVSDPVNFRGSALRSPEIEESAGSPAKREQQWSDGVRNQQ